MVGTTVTSSTAMLILKESRVQWMKLEFSHTLVKPQNRIFFYVFTELAYSCHHVQGIQV